MCGKSISMGKAIPMGMMVMSVIYRRARTANINSETGTTFFPKRPSQCHSSPDD
jgi:hypothetical protein